MKKEKILKLVKIICLTGNWNTSRHCYAKDIGRSATTHLTGYREF
jgi:hypothetical protein